MKPIAAFIRTLVQSAVAWLLSGGMIVLWNTVQEHWTIDMGWAAIISVSLTGVLSYAQNAAEDNGKTFGGLTAMKRNAG